MKFFKNSNINNLSDSELINFYKENKDIDCVGELYKRYTGFTFAICMKYLKSSEAASEAVLEIFENLIEKLLNYEVANFKTWLYSVTKNYCLAYLKNQKIEIDIDNNKIFDNNIIADTDNRNEEKYKKLELAIAELKEEQKICITLFYLNNKSYIEICQITNFSMNDVKSHLQNGKRNLKNIMIKYEE